MPRSFNFFKRARASSAERDWYSVRPSTAGYLIGRRRFHRCGDGCYVESFEPRGTAHYYWLHQER